MKIRHHSDLMALRGELQLAAVIAGWAKLGYFDKLSEPRTLTELGGDPRALAITAPILAHAGLLVGDGQRWSLSAVGRQIHASHMLSGTDLIDALGDYSRIDAVLAKGGPVRDAEGHSKGTRGGVRDDEVERSRRFLRFLYDRSEGSANECARWLVPRLGEGAHVLDLGGGHGRYARTFVDRGLRATIFDRPLAVDLAREMHGDRIAYRTGDYLADDLGGPYDAAFLSNIVHSEPAEDCARLIGRVVATLEPGGLLIVKDMFIDDLGDGPEYAVMFGLTMLFYTGGRTYKASEVASWCRAARLGEPELITFDDFALLLARKAG